MNQVNMNNGARDIAPLFISLVTKLFLMHHNRCYSLHIFKSYAVCKFYQNQSLVGNIIHPKLGNDAIDHAFACQGQLVLW